VESVPLAYASTHLSALTTATIDLVILFNRLTSSFGIMGSSHNWLKSYLSNRSFTVTSGSTSSSIYRHLVVFHKALSWVLFFSQSMSHLLHQLFPLTVSINSSMLTIHNSFSSFPRHLFLAVFAVSSVYFFLSQLVPPQWSRSKSN